MATISAASNERVYSIQKWGGLNEHPDGDTRLKIGEASAMSNFKVTRDGNLKRRPGTEVITGICESYSAHISDNIQRIMSFSSEEDTVVIYEQISTNRHPGVISLVGYNGSVERGVWDGTSAEVADGAMTENEEHPFLISGGVLRMANDISGQEMLLSQLMAALQELDDGEYLYTASGEAVFALTNGSLTRQGTGYVLAGYLVQAVPNVQNQPIAGMWSGYAGGKQVFLAACNGKVWSLWNDDRGEFQREYVGTVNTDKSVNFIPFDGKVYIQDGHEYYVYDGSAIAEVAGYIPLVAIAIGPLDTDTDSDSVPDSASDPGTLTGEYVNRLIPKRRVWISPDGVNKVFQLPEKGLKSIDSIIDLSTGEETSAEWTSNAEKGQVSFLNAPAKAVNAFEIGYTAKSHADDASIPDYRAQVTANLFAELYSGTTDSMLVFYGDGTNRALYTGMDYNGLPRADYFPDQYELRVGDSNTPITGMVRDGGALVTFKPGGECWAVNYGQITLATGDITTAMYVTPINRDKGHEAPGQVRLVNNSPVTCSGGELYHWINSSYYASNLTRDERQAKRISDRIQKSLKEIDLTKCIMWDDNDNQEYYVVGSSGMALVWNYAADVWYRYDHFPAVKMCNFRGDVFLGTKDGLILRMNYDWETDNGEIIQASWESGAMDFGAGHLRKYSSMLWVGLKPETGTSVDVCVETDRKNTFRDKIVSSTRAKVPGEPFMVRSKIKAKKFVYYRLLLSVKEKMPAVTVTGVDFRVRQTGYAK